MIIVCKECKTSFQVPDSVFAEGARTVRCARCSHMWIEIPTSKNVPLKPKVTPPPTRTTPQESVQQTNAIPPRQESRMEATAPPPTFASLVAEREPTRESSPPPPRFFTVARLARWLGRLILLLITLMVVAFLVFFAAQGPITKLWPQTEEIYKELGLMSEKASPIVLSLQNITSERRYTDGAMHLVVQGEIVSGSDKTETVPAIIVEAVGPDEKVIESWRIEPPKATIDSGVAVPFSSSIISPEGTVVEVNLSFSEPAHE